MDSFARFILLSFVVPFLLLLSNVSGTIASKETSKALMTGSVYHHYGPSCMQDGAALVTHPVDLSLMNADIRTDSINNCTFGNNGTKRYVSRKNQKYFIDCHGITKRAMFSVNVSSYHDCIDICDSLNEQSRNPTCAIATYFQAISRHSNNCILNTLPVVPRRDIEKAISLWLAQSCTSDTAWCIQLEIPLASQSLVRRQESILVPNVSSSRTHGSIMNLPTQQFVNHTDEPVPVLPQNLLIAQYDPKLSTDFPISPDTGILGVADGERPILRKMKNIPRLSRDGGKGGELAGKQIFMFCDTGSYMHSTDDSNGEFLGFVSSSVATDTGMHGLYGSPIALEDGIGEWSDDVGRMRGLIPLTLGEQGYNLAMQGNSGKRIAIWPESSIIPWHADQGIVLGSIVYDSVDAITRIANFSVVGNTLLTISAGGVGGPVAERTTFRMFGEHDVQFGSKGGIRSWGSTGIGGYDGRIYLFGSTGKGLLLARTDAYKVADKTSYEYWNGSDWDSLVPQPDSEAIFVRGAFQDVDMFYSPRHRTFIMVYQTIFADNTFYYRYLHADNAIVPPYEDGGFGEDYVENIVKYPWSEARVLFKATPPQDPERNYIYAGSVHQGYFLQDDISKGGSKMLLSWTSPTGLDPSAPLSEYLIVTAEVTLN